MIKMDSLLHSPDEMHTMKVYHSGATPMLFKLFTKWILERYRGKVIDEHESEGWIKITIPKDNIDWFEADMKFCIKQGMWNGGDQFELHALWFERWSEHWKDDEDDN